MEITLSSIVDVRLRDLKRYVTELDENTVYGVTADYLENTSKYTEAVNLATIALAIDGIGNTDVNCEDNIFELGGNVISATTAHRAIWTQEQVLKVVQLSETLDSVLGFVAEIATVDAQKYYFYDTVNLYNDAPELLFLTSGNLRDIIEKDINDTEQIKKELEDVEL